jgi:hypothetical protein
METTSREFFRFVAQGKRGPVEAIAIARELSAEGVFPAVITNTRDASFVDINGQITLTSRQIQRAVSPSMGQREISVSDQRPDLDGRLQEVLRTATSERRMGDVFQRDTTLFSRDLNGRLGPIETRSQVIRTIAAPEDVEEETIRRLDIDGRLALDERNVVWHTRTGDREQAVTETFARNVAGVIGAEERLELVRRVRRTTTLAPDGGGDIIEEVEERTPGMPGEPIRLVRRTVETVRRVDPDRWTMTRQLFMVGPNREFLLIERDTGDATGR